jgi:osmotically-inducible protein OsmY
MYKHKGSDAMSEVRAFLCGAGMGACLMYWLDPQQGRRRRALLRDQFVAQGHRAERSAGKIWRDTRNRAEGLAHELRGTFESDEATDGVLIERVRAMLGRVTSRPRAIEVAARDGHVTLKGTVPANEEHAVVEAVSGVKGVCSVESRLTIEQMELPAT